MRWGAAIGALAVGLSGQLGGAADTRGITLEQVMSAPFASELVAAPSGGKVAWLLNEKGARNVWVAEAPEYKGRRLTSWREDDGEELSELHFTADGQTLVFVRGGEANRGGEHPNPRSDPGGTTQAIFAVPVSGGEAKRLTEGSGIAVSPKGDRVAFVRKGQIFEVPLAGGEAKQLVHARGDAEGLRWSPDAVRLAFVSDRGDHAYVGLYEVETRAVRFLDPGVDRDGAPIFSRDGLRVAFLRVPAAPGAIPFVPAREGEPFSIRMADVTTGKGRLLFRAAAGRGSVFHGLDAPEQLLWTADERLVFPWERDGWTHLYSLPAAGGETTLLTPGEGEVEGATLAPGGLDVLVTTNQGDIDRRHVLRVPATGGKPTALTSGSGLEWGPVVAGDAVIVLRADANRPHGPALAGGSELRDLAPDALPAELPEGKLVVPQAVVFSAADGLKIHGQLFLPPGLKPGERRPAVVFFHGGSRRQMLLGWHYMQYYHNTYAMNQYLAARGYVVLSVNYRSGIGYGMEFREAENYGANGASEFQDVLGAGLYLRSRADVVPDRIGLWGGSYGGYLTALGLARASALFAAGVDLHGVHDWNVVIRNFAARYDPNRDPARARLAFESSPMAAVKDWRSPVLLIHGDDDRNVPFSETVELAVALRRQGVSFEELIFPDEIHDFLLHASWLQAYAAAADFLDRHLKR